MLEKWWYPQNDDTHRVTSQDFVFPLGMGDGDEARPVNRRSIRTTNGPAPNRQRARIFLRRSQASGMGSPCRRRNESLSQYPRWNTIRPSTTWKKPQP